MEVAYELSILLSGSRHCRLLARYGEIILLRKQLMQEAVVSLPCHLSLASKFIREHNSLRFVY